MATARDIVKASLRKIAVLGYGSTLSDDEAQDGLDALNAMVASWSVDDAIIYTESTYGESWSAGVTSKTIGSGGDIDTIRPTSIIAATYSISNNEYGLSIEGEAERAKIFDLTIQGTPSTLYYNANFPLATIYLWRVPNQAGTLKLYYRIPLTSFSTLDSNFAFPPEYEEALIYNLAVRLAPEYEKEPSNTVTDLANKGLARVKNQNVKNDDVVALMDDALLVGETFNIYTGNI